MKCYACNSYDVERTNVPLRIAGIPISGRRKVTRTCQSCGHVDSVNFTATSIDPSYSAVICLVCGDAIQSEHRHDFRKCSCGTVFVDGGRDYLRCGGDFNELMLVPASTEETNDANSQKQ